MHKDCNTSVDNDEPYRPGNLEQIVLIVESHNSAQINVTLIYQCEETLEENTWPPVEGLTSEDEKVNRSRRENGRH